jgi:class 3 adenylate cyclase
MIAAVSEPARQSLAEFSERYPWPEEHLELGKPVEWLWAFPLPIAPSRLWPHLIDTSRFNRALGLTEMHFSERDGVLHGWSVNGGRRQEWIEEPWSWVAGRCLTAVRTYSKGWAKIARVVYHLEATEAGSLFQVLFGFIPRGALGKLGLQIGVPSLEKGYRKVLDAIAADISRPRPEPYRAPPPSLGDDARRRLRELREQLAAEGVDPEILDGLVEHIEGGDPLDVYRIQPRRLAHEWRVDESAMLSACLHATRAGLLELSWDVICPHCRGVREETDRLSALSSASSCEVCEVDFGTDIENAVEVTFHVHASIREVPKVYYCSAEPSTKVHIKLQQQLAPGGELETALALEPGRYRLRLRGDRMAGYLNVVDGGELDGPIRWRAGDELGEIDAEPGEIALVLSNPGDQHEQLVIEEARWTDEALRPSRLFSFQEFRDLFSEEYLGADVQLNIGEQTILFTDMVGSTRFYRQLGDPAAFVKVKEHFGEVFDLVSEHRGAVVKTIGDAVMASFSDPLEAIKASIAVNQLFPPNPGGDNPIRLRISINTGACIAVNLNTGIDYFGGTVNVAAKLQACAEGGEVAISRRVLESPGVVDFLREADIAFEEGVFEHAALEPIGYARFCADAPAAAKKAQG